MENLSKQSYSAALYIHIPFCVKKCDYCDFYSSCNLSHSENLMLQIPQQLIKLSEQYSVNAFSSLYFGGGTPGLVNAEYMKTLLDRIKELNGATLPGEISMECNPRNITAENLETWAAAGINRISLGVQSFQDSFLEKAGRRSSRSAILNALEILKQYRHYFALNIDLIQGLPGMGKEDQIRDLKEAMDWEPDHLSWYSLILESGTVLSDSWKSRDGNIDVDNEDVWLSGCSFMEQNGYKRYEISNFCLPGKESVHNSSYWKMKPYIGCGPAAVSMLRNPDGGIIRFRTKADAESYALGQVEYDETEELSASDFLKDSLLMGLRITQGIDLRHFEKVFGIGITDILPLSLKYWEEQNCIIIDQTIVSCTERGMDLLNSILISFFEEIDKSFHGKDLNWPV